MGKVYDDYGYDLNELRLKALEEGKNEYAKVFNEALIDAAQGDPTTAAHICQKIAGFMSMNTTMNIFDIALVELDIAHVCDVHNPAACK